MFCSPPGRASAQLGPGRVKILRLAFQVTTASQQKKTPLFVFTSAPPATGQLLSRLITQPLDWLGIWCDCLLARSLGRVMVGNQPPAPLLLYPHPGKASVAGNSLAFVLPIHC